MKSSLLALAVLAGSLPAAAATLPEVLVKVNGVAVQRSEVASRLWAQYGNAVLNQMVDEILVRQEAAARKAKADPAEVDARLKRIQSQFPDEATFKRQLEATGGSLEAVRAQLEEAVLRETLVVKARKVSVSDAELKQFFEQNKEKLGAPEAVRLRHILVANEKQANDFLVAVKAGADFGKLASQVSIDSATKEKGGDLGFVSKGMLQPEIERTVFALKPGEASAVLKTPAGFHLFKVEAARPARAAAFDEVKKDLRAALLAEKITKAWPEYIQGLREKAKLEPSPQSAGR